MIYLLFLPEMFVSTLVIYYNIGKYKIFTSF